MDLPGKTIRWRWNYGPLAGALYEHVFNEDGTVTWRIVEGPDKGSTGRYESYGALRVDEKTWVIYDLRASGHSLTIVLTRHNDNQDILGFDCEDTFQGTFEVVN
jgi:hypothetical protein